MRRPALRSGDASLHIALTGSRFAVTSSADFARAVGYRTQPLDDLLVFNMVFGKTVPDISLNAVANLGYADCRFLRPVAVGDTLTSVSEVIGLKENSNRQTGVVHALDGMTSDGQPVLSFIRWVMVRKRDQAAVIDAAHVPVLPRRSSRRRLAKPARKSISPDGTMRWPAARCASRTTRPASGSIMSTG